MKKVLMSACLCGNRCRYKGDDCFDQRLADLFGDCIVIPVCAEQLGGLSTPRNPAERVGDRIISNAGVDVTEEYSRGARLVVEIAQANDVDFCVLKANSPSCGKGRIYDGSFTGKKIDGNGLACEKLLEAGFTVYTEEDFK